MNASAPKNASEQGEPPWLAVAQRDRERPWLLASEQSDHYLRLQDARIVGTKALLACQDNLFDVIEAEAMACVHGDAGHGKSLAVNAALRNLAPHNTVRVVFRARPHPRDIRYSLFHALQLPGEPPGHPIDIDNLLKDALAERSRVVVCDEAQWMARECFEYWRHLWDDRRTRITIVFVGGGDCYRVLRREPMLASRIYLWQQFRKMDRDEVASVIPVFHPVWTKAHLDLIYYADRCIGKGNFRNWARLTKHVLQGLARDRERVLDEKLLQWVASRAEGG